MKEIMTYELEVGDIVAKDVYNEEGNIVLGKDTCISEKHLSVLSKHTIYAVFVKDEADNESGIEKNEKNEKNEKDEVLVKRENIKEEAVEIKKKLVKNYGKVISDFKMMYANPTSAKKEDVNKIQNELDDLITKVSIDNNILKHMSYLQNEDSYTFQHSVNVAVYCAMIGKWLKLTEKQIKEVSLAGLLHDIGKSVLDESLIMKATPITLKEYEKLKTHSLKGYDILKDNSGLSPDILSAVLLHHERFDGSGYPTGMIGEKIPLYAKIVSVADVFDAVTSERVYSKKVSLFDAFDIIKDESFSGLDPEIVELFLSNITAFVVGNKVRLSDGRIGDVIYINKTKVSRPMVKVDDTFIDLSIDYSLKIDEVIKY